MPSELVIACSKLLIYKELTLAFAESATAGRLSAEFSLVPECGKMLKGGVVCYDATVKLDLLNVPEELIKEFTPESAEAAKAIAEGLQELMKADIIVGITGLTTAGGSETQEKPVGTMFIHAIINGKHVPVREVYEGLPEPIVLKTVDRVAELLINEIQTK
jgi:nicotinamide-nucleotide amidase